jgi:tRNA modification GTPase
VFATDDTIVAIATPVGRAGLGVIRVSGPGARDVAGQLIARKKPLAPRHATLATVLDLTEASAATTTAEVTVSSASSLDSVVVTFFPGPGSYTGQDTVEISAHGSPVVLERIVASAVRAGARMAQPGEFTLRAYVNGRLDLVQAEAVGDLIDAVTPTQVRQAFDQLSGTLTGAIRGIGDRLYALIVRLEASLDFPDEGYHFVETSQLASELAGVHRDIQSLLAGARRGRVIREGRQVVLVGGPNVGKSSLFNAIVGAERAIVTPVAGTTRDLVTERCEIEGSPITLVDTAGLREGAELVEQEGIRRARGAASVAAVALVVLDRSRPLEETVHAIAETAGLSSRILVANKSDLVAAWDGGELNEPCFAVSAVTGAGLGSLRRALVGALSGEETTEAPRVSNVRHIGLLEKADVCVCRAKDQAATRAPEELLLADIHEARAALDEVVGRRTPDDVLASIFGEFCIGK